MLALEHGEPLDEAVYCEVMFDKTISGEVPEHRDFICHTAIPKLERMGVKVRVLRAEKTYVDGNVKKCAVGKHPKSEKHGNTAQFSEVERSGTQENCGGIGSGCRLRLHPLPVLRRRQSHRVACIDPDAVVVDKNIAKNDRFDLFSR